MKKITSILLLLFLNSLTAQQTFSCGTTFVAPSQGLSKATPATPPIDPQKKYVLNVFFHLIFDNNGDTSVIGLNDDTFGLEQIQQAVKILNTAYNRYNIYFKYLGYDVTKNTLITNNSSPYNINIRNLEAINIYFKNNTCYASGCAVQNNIFCGIPFASTTNATFFNDTLIHEMGHCLGLLHVDQTDPLGSGCEHVTRNPLDPNYNADQAGDYVTDTPAQSGMHPFEFNGCLYIYNPSRVDCQNTPYENVIPGNYLASVDGFPPNCMHLTPGQIKRAKEHLEYHPDMPHWDLVFNTVESLYEPYEEVVVPGEITSSTNQQGGVLVCRKTVFKRSFQKGFAYFFSNTEPVNGVNVGVNTHYIYNDRPDHSIGVKIPQISNTVINTSVLSNVLPTICTFETYTSGKISSMSNLGSANITVTNLDENQVQDPGLYDNLAPQNYHIIDKNTESGLQTQTVIYKN